VDVDTIISAVSRFGRAENRTEMKKRVIDRWLAYEKHLDLVGVK